jgi:hypothetical protein
MSVNTQIGFTPRKLLESELNLVENGELFLTTINNVTKIGLKHLLTNELLFLEESSFVKDDQNKYYLKDPLTGSLIYLNRENDYDLFLDNNLEISEMKVFKSSHETKNAVFQNNGKPIIIRGGYSQFETSYNDYLNHKYLLSNISINTKFSINANGIISFTEKDSSSFIKDGETLVLDTSHKFNNGYVNFHSYGISGSDKYKNFIEGMIFNTSIILDTSQSDLFNFSRIKYEARVDSINKKLYLKITKDNFNSTASNIGFLLYPIQTESLNDRIDIDIDFLFLSKPSSFSGSDSQFIDSLKNIYIQDFGSKIFEFKINDIVPIGSSPLLNSLVLKFYNTSNQSYYIYDIPTYIGMYNNSDPNYGFTI